jgi:hypothetical protein
MAVNVIFYFFYIIDFPFLISLFVITFATLSKFNHFIPFQTCHGINLSGCRQFHKIIFQCHHCCYSFVNFDFCYHFPPFLTCRKCYAPIYNLRSGAELDALNISTVI